MTKKYSRGKKQMEASQKHWLECKEKGIDIWETKLSQEEIG